MSSRTAQKAAARQAGLNAERAKRESAGRGRARRRTVVGVLAALVVVAAAVVSTGAGAASHAGAGGRLAGVGFSQNLFAGIPQSGIAVGDSRAPVRLVEFADLQCPSCDEYAVHTLPSLVKAYVRTGKVQMRFENLSFIGPGSVAAGRVAAAASRQNKLWNFVDLLYLNQGRENSGYVTQNYLRHLLEAVPGLHVGKTLALSRSTAASVALTSANLAAAHYGISATPSFLIGRSGGPLHQFRPSSLDPAPFDAEINSLLGAAK